MEKFEILYWNYVDFEKNIEQIKELRKEYKSFPYLYKYNQKEENRYLGSYLTAKENLDAFCILYRNKLIAISIGCPFSKELTITHDLFLKNINMNNDNTYYFGDIIVNAKFQKKGIAQKLYKIHLEYIQKKGFKKVYALIVNRDLDKRKPNGYSKSKLWEKNHFTKTDYSTEYTWDTYQQDGTYSLENNKMDLYEKII